MTNLNGQFTQNAPKAMQQAPLAVLTASLNIMAGSKSAKDLSILTAFNDVDPSARRQAVIDRTKADMNRQAPASRAQFAFKG